MAMVTLRYWAAAREAAGVAEEKICADNLAAALAAALAARRVRGAAGTRDGSRADSRARADPSGQSAASDPAGPSAGGDPAERLRLVLARSSILIDGEPVGRRARESVVLTDAAVVEILPPFAGG